MCRPGGLGWGISTVIDVLANCLVYSLAGAASPIWCFGSTNSKKERYIAGINHLIIVHCFRMMNQAVRTVGKKASLKLTTRSKCHLTQYRRENKHVVLSVRHIDRAKCRLRLVEQRLQHHSRRMFWRGVMSKPQLNKT